MQNINLNPHSRFIRTTKQPALDAQPGVLSFETRSAYSVDLNTKNQISKFPSSISYSLEPNRTPYPYCIDIVPINNNTKV